MGKMSKQTWMREVEEQYNWADLWEGAWIKKNGIWRRFETLADLWQWSDVQCHCCNEPLLLTPDQAHLVCPWSASLTTIGLPHYADVGISRFPCVRCYSDVLERRIIENHTTTKVLTCLNCGLAHATIGQITAMDYLPVGYAGRVWQEKTEYQTINNKLDLIQEMLKEKR